MFRGIELVTERNVVELSALLDGANAEVGAVRRLRAAITSDRARAMDVVALARQALRRQELVDERSYRLRWPSTVPTPSQEAWCRAGMPYALGPDGSVLIGPSQRWEPDWRLKGPAAAVDLAVAAPGGMALDGRWMESISRGFEPVRLDPFLVDVPGIASYRGTAQREAVRAAVRCPAGGVLHVLLPTGTGKSLVGLARGLTGRTGTTVVVVPTVGLALDQEKQARSSGLTKRRRLPHHLAYYGGLDEAGKQEILDNVASGTQGVLFASPEAVVQGRLSARLHELAEGGGISALVIDESHLVAAWGGSFRPAFQLLPALRNGLLDACEQGSAHGFATITMSGTLSQHSLATLIDLFPADDTAVVGAAWLRSEPRFLSAAFPSNEERDCALIDTMAFLPRPAIIYVSRPERARQLVDGLLRAGYGRVASFHGKSTDADRRAVLAGWEGRDTEPSIDLVVGTSAFGLGIDVRDVRTVVHASLPETFDRYYQEVGRGGRDGHASISLLMTAPPDRDESAALRKETVIGGEKGWARWSRLQEGAAFTDDGWWPVPIDRRPDGSDATELDIAWNIHVANLMSHSKAVRLRTVRAESRPDTELGADEETLNPARVTLQARYESVVPTTQNDWTQMTDSHRSRVYRAVDLSGKLVDELLWQKRHTADLARDAYRVELEGPPRVQIEPVGACRGCPWCTGPPAGWVETGGTHVSSSEAFASHIAVPFSMSGRPYVLTVIDDDAQRERFVARMVAAGLPRVAGQFEPRHRRFWEHALRRSQLGWVVHDVDADELSVLPSIVLLEEEVPEPLLWVDAGPRVLVLRSWSTRPDDRRPLSQLMGTTVADQIGEER